MSRGQSFIIWTFIITVLFLIKTNISFFGIRLNLMVIVPFYIGLKRSPERGMAIGILVGLIEDSLSNTIIGPNILSKGAIGLLASVLLGRFFIWTPAFGVMACFAATLLDGMIVYICRELFFDSSWMFRHAITAILMQSLINAPIGYFIRPKDEQ